MPTAKLSTHGKNQAVRLPEECRFPGNDVMIRKIGDAVIMFPREKSWEVFIHGLNSFSDDFMRDGRE